MSTLNQLLERRRAAESRSESCHSIEPQPPCLAITATTGEDWVFPWSQLVSARLTHQTDRNELCLAFTSHEVTVRGLHLSELRNAVTTLRLAALRPAPTKYSRAAADQPFIETITVQAQARAGEQSA